MHGDDTTRLGQAAATAVTFDEPLAGSGLEQANVLARGRLADADGARGAGDAPFALESDEQPKARGIPEQRQAAIGQDDVPHRQFRLAR